MACNREVGEDSLRNPDLVREMEARGSVVSKTRLIRSPPTSCVIDELSEESVRLKNKKIIPKGPHTTHNPNTPLFELY